MATPKVSVVIPIYNTEATLPRCVDSVIAQTYKDLEIVLVDDGSPDGAGKVADDYAARYENVRVVHKQNGGLAEARRTGLSVASGDYIVPLDSDDDLPADAVEILLNHCTKEDLDLCYGAYMRIVGDEKSLAPHDFTGVMTGDEFLRYNLSMHSLCGACFCMSRREIWHDDVFPTGKKRYPSEDVFMSVRLAKYIRRMGIYNDHVYNYYFTPGSLSVGGALYDLDLWGEYFEEIRKYLKSEGQLDDALEDQIRIMEVDRISFYTKKIDKTSVWYRQVMTYDCSRYPRKTRILHTLLHTPSQLKALIALNRKVKKIL